MPVEKVTEVLSLIKEPMSLDTPVSDESDSTVGAFIEDPNGQAPDSQSG